MNNNNNITLFLIDSGKKFPKHKMIEIKQLMSEMDNQQLIMVQSADYKDPLMIFFISLFCGQLGIDRFLIGNYFLGVLKLITLGGLCIWYIIDLFLILDLTRKHNYKTFINIAESIK